MPIETDRTTSGRSFSVLIVEDEVLIAMDLRDMLESNGHQVIGPAASVDAALRLLDDVRPDVAVLDVNLRGRLVTPVAERLQSVRIPFVVSSSYPAFLFEERGFLLGAEHVGKPVDESRLLAALDRAVGGP
jgi:two-component system, response regulator PdtaR